MTRNPPSPCLFARKDAQMRHYFSACHRTTKKKLFHERLHDTGVSYDNIIMIIRFIHSLFKRLDRDDDGKIFRLGVDIDLDGNDGWT